MKYILSLMCFSCSTRKRKAFIESLELEFGIYSSQKCGSTTGREGISSH